MVRVQFKTEGGVAVFPGLSKPVLIDSDELPATEADELKRLIDEAGFFEQPAMAGKPSRGAADYRQYTITIDDGERCHTVQVVDPITDPGLQALVEFLNAKTKALRAAARAGAAQERSNKRG